MQRTEHPADPQRRDLTEQPAFALDDSVFRAEAGLFTASPQATPHALFAPLHYEPNYAYPLIVWLHGQGGDERHLLRIMPQVSIRNYVAVAPRGVTLSGDEESGLCGYGWQWTDRQLEEARQRVLACIELAESKFHIAPRRVFLAGFDTGGTLAFRMALERPDRFAGVLSLCGQFPVGRTIFANLVAARRLPIFLAAGRQSTVYPSDQVCANLRLLHSAGMSITLRQYPCAQELCEQMLRDIDRWIIEQITSASAV